MKIFFAGVHDGSNTYALLRYCRDNHKIDECYTFGDGPFDLIFTNNGRLVEGVPGRLKINTQHGNLFLGDTQPEPQYGINIALAASESEKAMMVRNGYQPENVLVTGQPRMDLLYQATCDRNTRIQYLQSKGLEVSKPTILYAPTYSRKAFGGGSKLFFASSTNKTCDANMMMSLLQLCDSYKCNLIIRMHKYVKRDYEGHLLPSYLQNMFNVWSNVNCEIHDNEMCPDSIPVLAASDILITDFSSIAADFLALGREIMFIDPQSEWKYTDKWHASKDDRSGMGFICGDFESLHERLVEIVFGRLSSFAPRRRAMRDKYQPLFDGKCCERVFNAVLERM